MQFKSYEEVLAVLEQMKALEANDAFKRFMELVRQEKDEYVYSVEGYLKEPGVDIRDRSLYYQGVQRGLVSVETLIDRIKAHKRKVDADRKDKQPQSNREKVSEKRKIESRDQAEVDYA